MYIYIYVQEEPPAAARIVFSGSARAWRPQARRARRQAASLLANWALAEVGRRMGFGWRTAKATDGWMDGSSDRHAVGLVRALPMVIATVSWASDGFRTENKDRDGC